MPCWPKSRRRDTAEINPPQRFISKAANSTNGAPHSERLNDENQRLQQIAKQAQSQVIVSTSKSARCTENLISKYSKPSL